MDDPAPMTTRLAHGTVGRFSPSVSMGVVQIGSTDAAIVQFLDVAHATELRVGQPVHQGGVTVTLLEAHPEPDFRASYLVVGSTLESAVCGPRPDADAAVADAADADAAGIDPAS